MEHDGRYGIEELADLGGVSRRTVRYYVQEGLLPAPLGKGRGRHYAREHLERLLRVKAMQERGLPLAAIRASIEAPGGERAGRAADRAALRPAPALWAPPRSAWARLELLPGVELHVSSGYRLPPPGKVRELAEWCRTHLRREEDDDA